MIQFQSIGMILIILITLRRPQTAIDVASKKKKEKQTSIHEIARIASDIGYPFSKLSQETRQDFNSFRDSFGETALCARKNHQHRINDIPLTNITASKDACCIVKHHFSKCHLRFFNSLHTFFFAQF